MLPQWHWAGRCKLQRRELGRSSSANCPDHFGQDLETNLRRADGDGEAGVTIFRIDVGAKLAAVKDLGFWRYEGVIDEGGEPAAGGEDKLRISEGAEAKWAGGGGRRRARESRRG